MLASQPRSGWRTTAGHHRETPRDAGRHHLNDADYRPSQRRYDLRKLRAKGLVAAGVGAAYRLTPLGLELAVVLVKLRMRLLGPLVSRRTNSIYAAISLESNASRPRRAPPRLPP